MFTLKLTLSYSKLATWLVAAKVYRLLGQTRLVFPSDVLENSSPLLSYVMKDTWWIIKWIYASNVWMLELDCEESWASKNWCFWTVVLKNTLEIPLDCKEIQPVHPKGDQSWVKDWCWSWNSNTLATWCEELTHWKRPWCWEGLGTGGEGDSGGWDGWMASLIWWTWV